MLKISIKIKVLLVLLLLTLLMILGMSISMQNGFNKGFFNYRKAIDKQFNDNLIANLAQYHQANKSWDNLKNNRRLWHDIINDSAMLLEDTADLMRRPPPRHKSHDQERPQPKNKNHNQETPPLKHRRQNRERPPHDNGNRVKPRLLPPVSLFDENKKLIIGKPLKNDAKFIFKEIKNKANQRIAYLGVVSNSRNDKQDKLFIKSFNEMILTVGIIMLILAVIITFPIAHYFTSLISKLTHATKKISAGDYSTRVETKRKDELGVLVSNFNLLAQSLQSNAASQKTMIADIAHELRTPVSVIIGEIEAIQDGIHQANQQTIGLLHSQITSLKNLVNDLHELSESDLGSLKYKMLKFDLVSLIEQCTHSHQLAFQEKNIELKFKTTLSQCLIIGDCNRLNQLLNNLLRNSIHYTNEHGNTQVLLSTFGNEVCLVIEDSAPTLMPEQMKKIFDRWYRAEKSRNKNLGGSGLGLAISQQIVKAHSGSIKAEESTLGGIKLTVTLPIGI